MNNPLHGLKILDLTRLLPGPLCTWHLASMGAEVLKVEDRGAGDYAKSFFQTDQDRANNKPSVFFRSMNHNKQIIPLDLKSESDQSVFLELVQKSDLVIESFRPGVMERLGLGPNYLMKLKPSLVYCAITGYGMDGTWKDMACHDINSLALTGVLDQMRDIQGRPIMANVQIADVLGGSLSAAMGCLAALWQAGRSGKGSIVDVSMTDGVLASNITAQVAVHNLGHTLGPQEDLLNGGVACYNLYQSSDDRWFALGALEYKFWEIFCTTVQKPEWTKLHWSFGHGIGTEKAIALIDEVQKWIGEKTSAYLFEIFAGKDCCFTPVLSLKESMQHPLFQERKMFKTDGDGQSWINSPVQFRYPT
jgi:crotonobetainyl-CoA:carnitine CoA-transferase CaiB-like acyl-CoA transferase